MSRIVVSLYDLTGLAVEPWAAAGFDCYCFDKQHPTDDRCAYPDNLLSMKHVGRGRIFFVHWDADRRDWLKTVTDVAGNDAYMVMGWPPCDDMTVSGAKHWDGKRKLDPNFQKKAARRATKVELVALAMNTELWMVENPPGALKRLWRDPDHSFHPYQYGGYLPRGSKHPTYPRFIAPRDAYEKNTFLWVGPSFVMPKAKAIKPEIILWVRPDGRVSKLNRQTKLLGGKTLKTKNIRSATPRGFTVAVFLSNWKN